MAVAFFALVVALAAGFAFLNGFRDVSTAVALSVRTRALTPSVAVVLAAVFNFAGVLLSGGFALIFSQSWVVLPSGVSGLTVLAAGLCSAILWGIYAWWRGVPLSSTHALVGGLVGAGAASAVMGGGYINGVDSVLLAQVVLPLLLSPVIAFLGAYLLVWPVTWAARYTQPDVMHGRFRHAQSVSAAAVAFGHGLQDGQRTVAVILLGAVAAGVSDSNDLPIWVILLTAVMLTAGTLCGGWRISYTLGYKLTRVDPMRGFIAQSLTSLMLFVGAIGFHLPLSTTHTVTSAVLGAGTNQNFSVTNRRMVLRILGFWVATPIVTAAVAFVLGLALSPLSH
ncbi:anion permease [Arthrobacter sp. efr-133-R2A-120]|uniref:inorganic phosphate transporter n=1 Tax=Arthrobacter sp. efr-133-R2A-120 TaxID=3040277 RepID=UPI0025508073|nr:anion permease [Arthrobacter sp. efr-133-R2A-120]